MTTVKVSVNRWFQKSYGNTYHKLYIVGAGIVAQSGIEYGYGDAWLLTLCDTLSSEGAISPRPEGKSPLQWLRDSGIDVESIVVDVPRKRDL